MCGIAGKLYFNPEARVAEEFVRRMCGVIAHRGPDADGVHVSGPVGLGHRRLSIIDLSPLGAQPMCNEDRTVWIVFNGEIYNFQVLREELLKCGHKFRSGTDTEVIIHAYEEYGVDCLKKLQGMFAFAIWDEKQKSLFIARDRVGIKPLYFCNTGSAMVFGSEIKSLIQDPEVSRVINPAAIDRFLSYLYIPGTETLFQSVQKLEPGNYLWIKDGKVTKREYWDLKFTAPRRWASIDEAADELWIMLKKTVREHMVSDVPVGFLLSGGVDSTALLSCAVSETGKRISTFTVGFSAADFADERPYARLAADRFGTDHHEITIAPEQFRDFLPQFVWHMEEPICEAPAISLYYVSKLARDHVKVVLSGEGGDEAFGGYQNYRNMLLLEKIKRGLGPLKSPVGAMLGAAGRISGFHRAKKYAPMMTTPLSEYYLSRVSSPFSYFNTHKDSLYADGLRDRVRGNSPGALVGEMFRRMSNEPLLHQMLYVDTKTWLPDDLLVKADKITMANSIELRVPLLDHLVLEFAASLPPEYKVRGTTTKRILKKAFHSHVPEEIINRKKAGFPIPYGQWFRTNLKDYVHDTLLSNKAMGRGYFSRGGVETLLKKCNEGQPVSKEVFSLLALELWHTRFVDSLV